MLSTIKELKEIIEKDILPNNSKCILLVGYSVGGYIAALLASMHPQLDIHGLLLLAPAIDNYERNFRNIPESEWYMPVSYVTTLRDKLPSRPSIKASRSKRIIIVHGLRDNDQGGIAPWRVREYVSELNDNDHTMVMSSVDTKVFLYQPDIDHSLEPWLSGLTSNQDPGPSSDLNGTLPLKKLIESLL